MLIEQTLQTLRSFKLTGFAEALSQQMAQPKTFDLSFEERLSFLVDAEKTHRQNKTLEKLLKNAKLRYNACPEDIDYDSARGLKKEQMASLLTGHWLNDSCNVLITGLTGTGKSWLGCALGHQACRLGHPVLYFRFSRLLDKLRMSRVDGTYTKFLRSLLKIKLLIIDDWLLEPLDKKDKYGLLDIFEDRYEKTSTLITTQLPVEKWHELIGDPTLADAILDRLLSKSFKLDLKGESMRKLKKD